MILDRTGYVYLAIIACMMLVLGAVLWYTLWSPDAEVSDAASTDSVSVLSGTTYTTLEGEVVSLSEFFGTPLLLVSWATWSPLSHEALSEMSRIRASYAEEELIIIGVNRAEQLSVIESFREYAGIPDSIVLLLDEADFFYTTLGGYDMPEIHLYDTAGERVESWHGVVDGAGIRTDIDAMRATSR